MTTDNFTTIREAFEAWYLRGTESDFMNYGVNWDNPDIKQMFLAWQAATSAIEAEIQAKDAEIERLKNTEILARRFSDFFGCFVEHPNIGNKVILLAENEIDFERGLDEEGAFRAFRDLRQALSQQAAQEAGV